MCRQTTIQTFVVKLKETSTLSSREKKEKKNTYLMSNYPAAFKERVVREYQPGVRGKGFQALEKKYKVGQSGPSKRLIKVWWKKWVAGGKTLAALESVPGGGRRSILTEKEKQKHILKFIAHKNLIGEAVDYKEVHRNVIAKTKKDISLREVRRIGKNELDITWKNTTLVTPAEGKLEDFLTYVPCCRRCRFQRVRGEISPKVSA